MTIHNTDLVIEEALPSQEHTDSQADRETVFREAHDAVDAALCYAKGLLYALDSAIELHPHLSGPDRHTEAIRALAFSIGEKIATAQDFHDTEWIEAKRCVATKA